MNLPMENCPTSKRLVDFLTGNIDFVSLERISEHLERCETCLNKAEKLNEEWQSLFAKLLSEYSNTED